MKIIIRSEGFEPVVVLEEPDTFTEFSVHVAGPVEDERLRGVLAGLGRPYDGTHTFIDVESLKRLAGSRATDADWLASLDGMVGFAASRGWVDEGGGIRAHVVRAHDQGS
jgi:hypothetical protein